MVKPNINKILYHNLCTGCGICEGACPSGAISTIIKDGRFLPAIDITQCKNSKGCHRCYDACPGVGVNLVQIANEQFVDKEMKLDKMCGSYLKCYSGFSNNYDIRYHSASGGMVSQFLIWLLENKKIDGAVVTRFDAKNPLLASSFLATTPEEIISARSSKYSPVSLNRAVHDIKNASGSRYVVVGLPCHIQGMRKLMAIDKKLREKVLGLFAIYCSSGRTFNLTEHVFKERRISQKNITYFQYRDDGCLGSMKIKMPKEKGNTIRVLNSNSESVLDNEELVYKERFQSYYHPLKSFFIPRRCLFCIDHYGELADICFGDIHIEPYIHDKVGVNSIIVKQRLWLDLLVECQKAGAITIDEIPFSVISSSQPMSFKKKGRNGAFVNIGQKLGWVMPKYDVDYLRQPTLYDWIDYCQNRVQQFLGAHKSLWWLVTILKADTSKLK